MPTKTNKMKKTLQLLSIIALVAFFISGCSTTPNDPKAVLKSFFEKLAKKDLDGAAKLATADSKSTLDMVKKGMDMAEKMKDSLPENDPLKEFQDVEFGDAKINGNTATVTVSQKNKKEQPPADFTLVKEDGKWKVDFSMGTLMKMGQQQVNKGADVSAPDTSGMNLKTEDLEAARKSLDSMMKNIDPKQLEEIQKQIENVKTPE